MILKKIKKDKRASEWHYIIVSLILGLLILVIVLYFFFQEYFNDEEINWETCRQSLIVRSGNAANILKIGQEQAFPFKCKTSVVNIDFEDYDKAGKIITDEMAKCWNLFNEGKLNLYSQDFLGSSIFCFNCARIHFDEKVKAFYSPKKNIQDYLNSVPEIKAKEQEIAQIRDELDKLNLSYKAIREKEDAWTAAEEQLSAAREEGSNEISQMQVNVDKLKSEYDAKVAEVKIVTDPIFARLSNAEKEYNNLIVKYSVGNTPFNWNNYLNKDFSNGQTYGQYIYGFNDRSYILTNDAFSKEPFTNGLTYDSWFDASKGDLIITLTYKGGAYNFYFWAKGYYSVLIPHQTSQPLTCNQVETIPA